MLFAILSLGLLGGCTTEIELDIGQITEPLPVLSGILETGNDNDVLRLWETAAPTGPGRGSVPGFSSIVYRDARIDSVVTQADSLGYLPIPENFPQPGLSFTIDVQLLNSEHISVADVAPQAGHIVNPEWGKDGTRNQFGEEVDQISFTIVDPAGVDNYYECFLFIISEFRGEPRITYLNDLYNPNVYLVAEGDQGFLPSTMFFSDQLFDGQTIRFRQDIDNLSSSSRPGSQETYGLTEPGLYLMMRATNKTYYDFMKQWVRHEYTQQTGQVFSKFGDILLEDVQDLIFSPEPSGLTGNVEGGLGVVGAVHSQTFRLSR